MKMRNKNVGLLIIRIAVGAIFLAHGIMKLKAMDQTIAMFHSMGLHEVFAWIVAFVETLGGAMMILGIFTSVVGVLLAIVMLVAMIKVHLPMGIMKAEFPFALFAATLGLSMTGAGKYGMGMVCKCGTCEMCKDAQNTCDSNCNCDCKK